MCLIIFAPKNTDKKDPFLIEAIEVASKFNPDGMGFAIKRKDNSLYVDKGYFDVNSLIKQIQNAEILDEEELTVHLRIGNRGKRNSKMTHPFLISKDENEILEFEEGDSDKPILFHNGTMWRHSVTNSIYSDTFHFTKNVLSKESVLNFLKEDPDTFNSVMEPHLDNSRMVIMFPGEDPTVFLGKWFKENDFYFSKDFKKEYIKPKKSVQNVICFKDYYNQESERPESNRRSTSISFPDSDIIAFPYKQPYNRPFVSDWLSNKYYKYLGVYLPVESTALFSHIIPLNSFTMERCKINCIGTNYQYGIFKGSDYEMINADDKDVILLNTRDNYEITVPLDIFYEEFFTEYDKEVDEYYSKYLKLIKTVNISKNCFKKLNALVDRAIERSCLYVHFKNIKFIPTDLAIDFLIYFEEELEIRKNVINNIVTV